MLVPGAQPSTRMYRGYWEGGGQEARKVGGGGGGGAARIELHSRGLPGTRATATTPVSNRGKARDFQLYCDTFPETWALSATRVRADCPGNGDGTCCTAV